MIWAIIKTQKEGFHWYKDAPEQVKFLCDRHRHIFHITVYLELTHNEREIEFFIFKHWLEENLPEIDGPESCETIATNIKNLVEKTYKRKTKVQVMEDNENGALVE